MRFLAVIICVSLLTGCDIHIATASDAEEARLANDYLNAQLAYADETVVNWKPMKDYIKLSVLDTVDADKRKIAIAALRHKQGEEGWRTIEVVWKNGEVDRLRAGP